MDLIFSLAFSLLLADPGPLPPIVALAVTPDGQQAVAGSQAGVQILTLPEAAPQRALSTALEQVHDLAFSPRGDVLAIAGGSPGEKGSVELWNWPEGKQLKKFNAGGDVAYRVAWNADGTALAIAGGDKKVRIQPTSGAMPAVYESHSAAVLAVAWLPAENLAISAGVDQSLRVLDPTIGKIVHSLDNHTAAVRDLVVRPGKHDGPTLIASAGADRTVRFWQPEIGRLVRFVRLPAAPTAICWTAEGTHVLAACEDGRLRAIDPETVAVVELAAGPRDREADASRSPSSSGWLYSVAPLPDGKSALVGGERGRLQIVPTGAITP